MDFTKFFQVLLRLLKVWKFSKFEMCRDKLWNFERKISLLTSSLSVILSLIVGGTIGLLAAYYKGLFDRIIMRFMDVLFAFPILLLAIGIIAVIGPSIWGAAIAIAVVYTPIFARLIRGPALVICETEYVETSGSTSIHVVPSPFIDYNNINDQNNQNDIQKAFNHRAKMNGLSSKGEWSESLEKEAAA